MEDEKNLEPVDVTDELVNEVVENVVEEMQVRPIEVLKEIPYEELTDAERKYLIAGLKAKNEQLDEIFRRSTENNRKVIKMFNDDITKIEDAFEFIQTISMVATKTINLTIKNVEREVREHGN